MSKAYLSFLGTNNYLPCTYYLNDREAIHTRFVQEATVRFACSDWAKQDRLLIFTTQEAYNKNWLNDGHPTNGAIAAQEGLECRLRNLPITPLYENIMIPEGKNESEIWEIFQIVYDQLQPGDQVVLDITHALRSIPMLALVALNYAKVLKGVQVEAIYYGAFEVIGTIDAARKMAPEKRRAPLFDLTAFDQLLDWTTAIDRFSGSGDASAACALAKEKIRPLLKNSQGADKTASSIREVINSLEPFTQALATCRGREISPAVNRLKQTLARCENLHSVKPLGPLLEKLQGGMAAFPGDEIGDGLQAVRWCLDHNLIQQGFTILQEIIITHLLKGLGLDFLDKNNRELINQGVTIFKKKLARNEWKELAGKHAELIEQIKEMLYQSPALAEAYSSLSDFRNDLNHAGFRKNSRSPDKFKKKLLGLIAQVEPFLLEAHRRDQL
jgi:CRISPR-associated Csx2 family protein